MFIGSLIALLIILPFYSLNYILRSSTTEQLYFTYSECLKQTKSAFKHSSVRNFFKLSLKNNKNDEKLLDLIGDIHILLKTKDVKDAQELAKEMVIKHFDEDIHPIISKEFSELFKSKVDKPLSIKKQINKFVDKVAEDFAKKHYWEEFLVSEHYIGFDNLHLFLSNLRKKSIRTLNDIHEYLRVSILVDSIKDSTIFRDHVKHYNEDLRNRSSSSIFRSKRGGSSIRQSTVVSSMARVSLATANMQNKSQVIAVSPSSAANKRQSQAKSTVTTTSANTTKITTTSTTDSKGKLQNQQISKNDNTKNENDTLMQNSLVKSEARYSSRNGLSTNTNGSDSENMVLNNQISGDSSNSHSATPTTTTNSDYHKPSTPPKSTVFSYSNALSSGRDTSTKESEGFSKDEISRYSNKEDKDGNGGSTNSLSHKLSYTNNDKEDS